MTFCYLPLDFNLLFAFSPDYFTLPALFTNQSTRSAPSQVLVTMSAAKAPTYERHLVEEYINPSTWALIQDKFSPLAKELLTKVIKFIHVRDSLFAAVSEK